jgi:hypothetical protein
MKALGEFFANLFPGSTLSEEDKRIRKIYREWDRQRSRAYGPNDLAEIDAIFSRALDK